MNNKHTIEKALKKNNPNLKNHEAFSSSPVLLSIWYCLTRFTKIGPVILKKKNPRIQLRDNISFCSIINQIYIN